MRQACRLRQTIAATALQHPAARLVEIDPVPYRNVDRLHAPFGAKCNSDYFVPVHEQSAVAGLLAQIAMFTAQYRLGAPDSRDIQYKSEMGRQPQPARVRYPLRIGNEQIRRGGKLPAGSQYQRHLPKGQQPRHVWETDRHRHHAALHHFHRRVAQHNDCPARHAVAIRAGYIDAGYKLNGVEASPPHHPVRKAELNLFGIGNTHVPSMNVMHFHIGNYSRCYEYWQPPIDTQRLIYDNNNIKEVK